MVFVMLWQVLQAVVNNLLAQQDTLQVGYRCQRLSPARNIILDVSSSVLFVSRYADLPKAMATVCCLPLAVWLPVLALLHDRWQLHQAGGWVL
jgi:hypothetical protein